MDNSYLKFNKLPRRYKSVTDRVEVFNAHHGSLLGMIKWWPAWRQYVFVPEPKCVFNYECLNTISKLVEKMTKEHRQLWFERRRG